jgi:hypothetical protein
MELGLRAAEGEKFFYLGAGAHDYKDISGLDYLVIRVGGRNNRFAAQDGDD